MNTSMNPVLAALSVAILFVLCFPGALGIGLAIGGGMAAALATAAYDARNK